MGYFGQIVIAPATPPAGASGQVQFNDAGAFGADAGLAFDKTTKALAVGGHVKAVGALFTARNTAPSDAELANGQMAIFFDATANRVRFRARNSGGQLRQGQVNLGAV